MADSNQAQGFALPAPQAAPATQTSAAAATQSQIQVLPAETGIDQQGPQPRDYVIGGGILVVLLIAFFFVKGAYANHLAGKRVSPGPANAAGWWLFIFLSSLAIASVLAITSPVKFLTPLFMGPICIVGLVAIILVFISGRRS